MSGVILYVLCLSLTNRAMLSNAYFSTAVRIQDDSSQQVCQIVPYRNDSHPGYFYYFIQAWCVPCSLGAHWALIYALPADVSMNIHTSLENRILHEQLAGIW